MSYLFASMFESIPFYWQALIETNVMVLKRNKGCKGHTTDKWFCQYSPAREALACLEFEKGIQYWWNQNIATIELPREQTSSQRPIPNQQNC